MDVQQIIAAAATKYGLDPATMLRIAEIESGLRPDAQNPSSSAGGLFQFIDSTWNAYGGGDKRDPYRNADAAGQYLRDATGSLAKALGRAPEGWETYVAHQQGPGGAASLFRADPGAPAASIVGEDAVRLNGGRDGMTVGDFLGLWRGKYNGQKPALSFGAGTPAADTSGYGVPAAAFSMGVPVPGAEQNTLLAQALTRPKQRAEAEAEQRRGLAALIR